MQRYLKATVSYLHSLSLRERILAAGVLCTLLYLIGDTFLLSKQLEQLNKLRTDTHALTEVQQGLDLSIVTVSASLQAKNKAQNTLKQNIAIKTKELAQQNKLLSDYLETLVPPTQITTLLRNLVTDEGELHLISIKNEPVKQINLAENLASETIEADQSLFLYEHTAIITLSGSYNQLFSYLAKLETAPWELFWDTLQFTVTESPNAEIVLRVHTLSASDYWIGL